MKNFSLSILVLLNFVACSKLGGESSSPQSEINNKVNTDWEVDSSDESEWGGTVISEELLSSSEGGTEPITNPGSVWKLNPESLKGAMFERNITLLLAANDIYQAKERINIARGRLLPSLDLSAILSPLSGPSFLNVAVQTVLPFLMPSRWADLNSSKAQARASQKSYKTTSLNLYSSLLALYATTLSDQRTLEFLANQVQDNLVVEQITEQAYEEGRVNYADVLRARSQTAQAKIRFGKMKEHFVEVESEFHKALKVDPATPIAFDMMTIPESKLELKTMREAFEQVWKKAPEVEQLLALVESSKQDEWSRAWGIISGPNLSGSGSYSVGDNSAKSAPLSFSNMSGGFGFHFGFDYFPMLRLSSLQTKAIVLRIDETRGEIVQILEKGLGKLGLVFERLDRSHESEQQLQRVFQITKERFAQGQINLTDVLQVQSQLREAQTESLRADSSLDLLRITLHRLDMTSFFDSIGNCEKLVVKKRVKVESWEGGFMGIGKHKVVREVDKTYKGCSPEAMSAKMGYGS